MPFQDGVYYPLSSDAHSSAGIPSLLNSPSSGMTPSSGNNSTAATFKFRPRRETVDWRRINAVDVDQVVSHLDVDALQEHVATVTFCSLEGERCPRCQAPVDPALVKLLRLAQLTVEWLLHCQELLALNLRAAEERLAVAGRERDELLEHQRTQEERARALAVELKQRKKVIRTQQTLLAPRIISHKCPHCEKKFLDSTFLQSHMQRRHPDDFDAQLQSKEERKSQIDGLKSQISGLKEQIVQQQQALEAKAAREEQQQSLHKDLLKELERFKAEEISRMDRKIEDSRDGMRREMEFIYNHKVQALNEVNQNQVARPEKTTSPERDVDSFRDEQIHKLQQLIGKQDRKWESRLQEVKSQHEFEKKELQDELSQMRRSVSEQQKSSKRLQEKMSRTLQEKEQTIQSMREQREQREWREQREQKNQRDQVKSFSVNTSGVEVPVVVAAPPPEPRQKRVMLEEPGSALKLDPIQELSEEDRDSSSKSERKPAEKKAQPAAERKQRANVNMLKRNPNMKKALHLELKQAMGKKLENLGVRPDQSGLKNQDVKSAWNKLQSKQQNTAKTLPDFWRQRKQICVAVEKKLAAKRRASDPALHEQTRARHQGQVLQIRPRSSSLPPRTSQQTSTPAVNQPKTPQPAPRTRTSFKTSTPHIRTTPTRSSPPFSSDEESDDRSDTYDDESSPKPRQARSVTSGLTKQAAVTKQSFEDEDDWSFSSELEEIDIKQLGHYRDQNGNVETRNTGSTEKENRVSELARLTVKQSAQRVLKIPAGGVSVLLGKKDEVQELKYSDLEESSDRIVSTLQDKAAPPRKSLDFPGTNVWGTSTGKNPGSGHFLAEAGTGSTLKSSLCSLSDISDDVSSEY